MDARDFDRLTRFLGEGQSRRRALRAIAGGSLAAMAGLGRAGAAFVPRPQGAVCTRNADCASDLCLPKDSTGRRRCGCLADPISVTCGTLCGPQINNCGATVDCGACCTATGQPCDIFNPGACCSLTCGASQAFTCAVQTPYCCIATP